ncbi:unnamed protein product [Prunus brigantina]
MNFLLVLLCQILYIVKLIHILYNLHNSLKNKKQKKPRACGLRVFSCANYSLPRKLNQLIVATKIIGMAELGYAGVPPLQALLALCLVLYFKGLSD